MKCMGDRGWSEVEGRWVLKYIGVVLLYLKVVGKKLVKLED